MSLGHILIVLVPRRTFHYLYDSSSDTMAPHSSTKIGCFAKQRMLCHSAPYSDPFKLWMTDTSRHQCARRDGRQQKMFKIVMFDSEKSRVNSSQSSKKEKKGTFKTLGLVAAQCNGIAACAYSLKIFTVHTLVYLTVHGLYY